MFGPLAEFTNLRESSSGVQRHTIKAWIHERPRCLDHRCADRHRPRDRHRFREEGARLIVAGRHENAGQQLAAELRRLGADAAFIKADVQHEDEVRDLVDQTVARFGRLDAAVNNAGTEGKPGPVTEQTAESYAATFDTNVLGTLLSTKHELRAMLAQCSGAIVNISSTYGHAGTANASVYAASKHAVEGLTTSAALEVAGSRVRINAVVRGPPKLECSIASPAMLRGRLGSSRPYRSAASASPTRSPMPSCFFAPTRRPLSAAMCFRSMAESWWGRMGTPNPRTAR